MVIENGLAPGETVVTDGQMRIFPGATIKAVRCRQAGNGAAMNLSRIFIDRPIMTALVCFAILLFGVVGIPRAARGGAAQRRLPHHPGGCGVPGASPETMASSVATPLEREFSTIAGVQSMSSVNSQGRPRSPCSSRWTATSTRRRRISRPTISARRRTAAHQHAAAAFLSRRSIRPSSRSST